MRIKGVRNVSFSENFAYLLNEPSLSMSELKIYLSFCNFCKIQVFSCFYELIS